MKNLLFLFLAAILFFESCNPDAKPYNLPGINGSISSIRNTEASFKININGDTSLWANKEIGLELSLQRDSLTKGLSVPIKYDYHQYDSLTIAGLNKGTVYFYRFYSNDGHQNFLFSQILQFTTSNIVMKQSAAGASFSMGLTTEGRIMTWGRNQHGQLGIGNLTDKISPGYIASTEKFSQIAAGYYHCLAIDQNGKLWAWGYNFNGQLGTGKTTDETTPVLIAEGQKFSFVAAGANNSFAIDTAGHLWAWGDNYWGQLGAGEDLSESSTPVEIMPQKKFIWIASSYNHSLAIDDSGHLWSTGDNSYGQIGDGTKTDRYTPVEINSASTYQKVAAGYYNSLAIQTTGTLQAWGYSLLVPGSSTYSQSSPFSILSDQLFSSIACGESHCLACDNAGKLWSWGSNIWGQLGNGSTRTLTVPVEIGASQSFSSIALGEYHSLAIDSEGGLWTWGCNTWGQLGTGDYEEEELPQKITF